MTTNSKQTSTHAPESKPRQDDLKAYKSNWEHLSEELRKLDALIHLQVLRFRDLHAGTESNGLKGLYIADGEIDRVLEMGSNRQNICNLSKSESDLEALAYYITEIRAKISHRIELSLKLDVPLFLHHLSCLFNLTPFELDAILICLAPELNAKYEKLYAYLQDDVTRKKPSIALILNLLCNSMEEEANARAYFRPFSSLFRYRLIDFANGAQGGQRTLLSESLKLNERIVDFLLGFAFLDSKIGSFVRTLHPRRDWSAVIMDHPIKKTLMQLSKEYMQSGTADRILFCFFGPYGVGKKLIAEAFCETLKLPLLVVDTRNLLNADNNCEETARLIFRESLLQPAAIFLEHFDSLITHSQRDPNVQNGLIRAIDEFSLVTFLAGEKPFKVNRQLKKHRFISAEFPIPAYPVRRHIWQLSLDGQYPVSPDVNIDFLANKFRFTAGQIKDAVSHARDLAMMHHSTSSYSITMEDLYQSCREQSNQGLSTMARKIVPHYTWTDIVLPMDKLQHLKEICNYVRSRQTVFGNWGFDHKFSMGKGLNVLFSGPSGTGKTMAAEIITNALKLDLYKIDLSCVVSKYIGETEKNLSRIFKEAETSNAILFFDEADALFGKRSEVKDSHDRYANIEIGYLLQKMEEHEGIVILASNLRKNIDEAFTRRMVFSVDFPFPDEKYRLKIWQNIFPNETPKGEDINFEFLAKRFKISGGSIKNIAVNAAFLAAEDSNKVYMKHIIQSTKREYQKMGKLCTQIDFGEYYDLKVINEEQ